MKNLMFILTAIVCGSLWAQDGFYIEAETITPKGDWIIATQTSGYTGSGYLAYTGPSNRNQNDAMSWEFNIITPGNYLIQLRCRRDQEYGCPANAADDECNDVFSRVNNGSWEKTMVKRAQYGDDDGGSGNWGNWFWDGRLSERTGDTRPLHTLNAGKNTYSIASRSAGVKIDAIAVFKENTSRPMPVIETGDDRGASNIPTWSILGTGGDPFILLYVQKGGPVSFKLYNVQGRMNWRYERSHMAPGCYRVPLQANKLHNGLYIAVMENKEGKSAEKTLVMR